MKARLPIIPLCLCLSAIAAVGQANQNASLRSTIQESLGFEQQKNGSAPTGWYVLPAGSAVADQQTVHTGRWSVRLERTPATTGSFSAITKSLPIDFLGGTVELRGFLRTKDVSDFAGLWLREDGDGGQMLRLENMQGQHVNGTRDWAEYAIKLPLDRAAKRLYLGLLMAGTGTLWADDLQLMVDGKPIADAAAKPLASPSPVDTDHEFDGGSRIAFTSLSPLQIENLATLGRVWGFLKYHHPAVAGGQRQWDYDLFRAMPAILAARDHVQANEALAKWIASLGEVASCTSCAAPPSGELSVKPDIDWIHQTDILGVALRQRLEKVYANRPAQAQFYVSQQANTGNPSFDHELSYAQAKFPDAGFQLLALFRWWNMVQYWAPYRETAGQNWLAVLAEFIPKVALAKDKDAYALAMMQAIAKANDTHANLWSSLALRPPAGPCSLPATFRFIANEPVVAAVETNSKTPSALRRGDVLEKLDGAKMSEVVAAWSPYYADSNEAARQRDLAASLARGSCGPASVAVRRGTRHVELTIERTPGDGSLSRWHDLPGDTFRLLSPDVAYLKLSTIKAADVPRYLKQAEGTRGLIIDIRDYPSEFMPFVLGPALVTRPTSFASFTYPDLANPGAYHFVPGTPILPGSLHYSGKVAILVDEMSQSQAEYTAMALRAAPGAIVVGSTTAGADGNVSQISLPGGLNTMISGIGIFYPDHGPTQRIGIIPDVEVWPTLAGIKSGRDEVLEAAVRRIVGSKAPQAEITRLARPDVAASPAPLQEKH